MAGLIISLLLKKKKVKGNWFSALKMKRKRTKEKSRPTVTEAHELLPFLWVFFLIRTIPLVCNTIYECMFYPQEKIKEDKNPDFRIWNTNSLSLCDSSQN